NFAEVHVLKGMVEVSPVNEEDNAPSVLRENETRRFGKGRKAGKHDLASQHLRLAQFTPLDRWNQKVNFVHWSFNEATSAGFKGESSGIAGSFDITPAGPTSADGRWDQALHLDGRQAFSATAPGISRPLPRTIAFWVRVPESLGFPDSHAIVSWPVHSKKFGNRALQTGWNRNPNQGPIGALRTELGKNYAVGATPLCDGKWHHIAVSLVPVGSGDAPLQVTQYVDGRLEGTTVRAIKSKRIASESGLTDVVSLGRAPGKHGKDKGCFHGDLDELFITDRALSQPEIAALMTTNTLPRFDLTSLREAPSFLIAQSPIEP
ncbi:MAG TPA: LamG-like jellyroll fold domain-containing protein, partial [Verrucomicrobiaceae bacterium]